MNKSLHWLLALVAPISAGAAEDVWNFRVYLDDKPVGFHRFTVSGESAARRVHSIARFDVKFLGFTAYRYAHEANERWQGDCLAGLDANTDDNGDRERVSGVLNGQGFELKTNDRPASLPSCVMSFAYWHPRMLSQQRLLNPQNGEFTAVTIRKVNNESIPVGGSAREAVHYRLDAEKFKIDLWYGAEDGRWLALDSTLEGGRTLRYRIE